MFKFLRYNSRHHFYWRIGDTSGKYGRSWPMLNPISGSVYGSGIRNISWHEPIWLFRLRQQFFAFAGRQRCPNRSGDSGNPPGGAQLPDTWDLGPDGARTCSYCGSLHPADWTDIMWRYSQHEEGYDFDRSDKGYKDYGHRPGVRNASEGGIKFYGWHVPDQSDPLHDELYAARQLATTRYRADMEARWGRGAAG